MWVVSVNGYGAEITESIQNLDKKKLYYWIWVLLIKEYLNSELVMALF